MNLFWLVYTAKKNKRREFNRVWFPPAPPPERDRKETSDPHPEIKGADAFRVCFDNAAAFEAGAKQSNAAEVLKSRQSDSRICRAIWTSFPRHFYHRLIATFFLSQTTLIGPTLFGKQTL